MKQRLERLSELVRQVVGQTLQRLFPQSHLTITQVELSPDLRYADVSISQLKFDDKNPEAVLDNIYEHRKELQTVLGQSLKTKFTPKLRFHLDTGNQKARRVDELLNNLRSRPKP